MHFTAPWDTTLKVLTSLTLILLLGVLILLIGGFFYGLRPLIAFGFSGMDILFILLCYLYAPKGFYLSDSHLVIERRISPIRIEIRKIKRVSRLPQWEVSHAARTFGVRGFFGYYGIFRNERLGRFRMYATDRGKGVLIEADRKYLITPDRPEHFIRLLRAKLAH